LARGADAAGRAASIGCPHEKQTETTPGVAIVAMPHDGHVTSLTIPTASVPPFRGASGGGAGATGGGANAGTTGDGGATGAAPKAAIGAPKGVAARSAGAFP
jgi:hypothetical protein